MRRRLIIYHIYSKKAVLIGLLFCVGQLWAQNKTIDSLKQVIESNDNDSLVLDAYQEWDSYIYNTDPELDLELNLKILEIIEQNKFNYEKYAHHLDHYKLVKAKTHNNIGLVLTEYYGAFPEAMDHFQLSHMIALQINDSVTLSMTINNMGLIAQNQGDWLKALDFYTQSKELDSDPASQTISYNNIGVCYNELKDYDRALENYKMAVQMAESIDYHYQRANSLGNIGIVYYNLQDYDKCIQYCKSSDSLASIYGYIKVMSFAKYNQGKSYIQKGEPNKAIGICLDGLQIADTNKILFEQKLNCKCLYLAYKDLGNYDRSLHYHELFKKYEDSIINIEKNQEIIRSEHNFDLKKQHISDSLNFVHKNKLLASSYDAQIEKSQLRQYLLSISLLAVLFILFVALRAYRVKKHDNQKIAEAHARIEQEKKAKELFIAKTSHDLRSPLHTVSGNLELLQSQSKFKNDELLQSALDSSDYLMQIVEDILDQSKLEAGEISINLAPFNIRNESRKLVKGFEMDAEKKGIDLDLIVEGDVPEILESDVLRIKQIITNLISNAIKFTEQGFVQLKIAFVQHLIIEVEDSGIGIPKEMLSKLTNPYQQVRDSDDAIGTGLGLSIVKQLAELLNGELQIRSELEKGSCFSVKIPVNTLNDNSAGKTQNLIDLQSKTILIVDDSVHSRSTTAAFVSHLNGNVVETSSWSEAESKIMTTEIDLMIIDQFLQNENGFESASHFLRDQQEAVKTIGMSGRLDPMDESKWIQHGFQGILLKPFGTEQLSNLLKEVFPALKSIPPTSKESSIDQKNITNFITEVPSMLEKAIVACQSKEREDVKFLLHKVKPCYFYIDQMDIYHKFDEIEQNFESYQLDDLKEFLKQMETETDRIILAFKA